jgi:cellulose synthase/poly-beta-1,6-N-acetylglucosamine synthase-like glycosyltransferase
MILNNASLMALMVIMGPVLVMGQTTAGKNESDGSLADLFSDWRIYLPFYISFVRWGMFFILKVIPSFFYRQKKYLKLAPLQKKDVTAVVAVYDPPAGFQETLLKLIENGPGRIVVVGDSKFANKSRALIDEVNRLHLKSVHELTHGVDQPYIEPAKDILVLDSPVEFQIEIRVGKRHALETGVKVTTTPLIAFVDDDVKWSNNFLEKLIAPFQHNEKVGGVGCKQVARIKSFFDVWGVMADMRLAVRFLELMATTTLDGGCSCLSGRTACYRTEILQTDEFYDYLINETFCGHQVQSGDDKCITRFIINKGYKTYHQLRSSCELDTSFETGSRFFLQMVRWARNTWRSDIKSIFVERHIWKNTPLTAFIILDKMITPFIIVYGLIVVILSIWLLEKRTVLVGWLIWLVFTRSLKLCYYLWKHPQYIVYIPVFIAFQYVQGVVRIYALLTLFNMNWGTKDVTVKDGKVVRKSEIGQLPNETCPNVNIAIEDEREDSSYLSPIPIVDPSHQMFPPVQHLPSPGPFPASPVRMSTIRIAPTQPEPVPIKLNNLMLEKHNDHEIEEFKDCV